MDLLNNFNSSETQPDYRGSRWVETSPASAGSREATYLFKV